MPRKPIELKYTAEHLREMQVLPLYRKVGITIARLTEYYNHFGGKVFVSFSGGKDSTVLLHIARKLYPDIRAVFANTGLEYPEIVEFVKTFDNVDMIRPEMPFNQVIKKYGYPVISKEVAQHIENFHAGMPYAKRIYDNLINGGGGKSWREMVCRKWLFAFDAPFKISAKCCDIMKKKPFAKYDKENGTHPILATMAEESLLRKTAWLKTGCNAFDSKSPKSTPMAFWTEQDVLQYIAEMKIPIAPVYGEVVKDENGLYRTTGEKRTGCMFCLFGCHLQKEPNKIQRLEKAYPKIHEYILDKLNFREVMDYFKIPYTTRQMEFDFIQPDAENNEPDDTEETNDRD